MQTLIALTATGMITLFGGIFNYKKILLPLIYLGVAVALFFSISGWNQNISIMNNMMMMDNYAICFSTLLMILVLCVLFLYQQLIGKAETHEAEVYSILVFATVGAVAMVSFTNMLMLFLGIEILSLSMYVLAGIRKTDLRSNEAAMKYFLMGSFSTGFLLFGIALIYGAVASFDLKDIANYASINATQLPGFFIAGMILILVGLLFKVAAVPFQFWTPDVYDGSPTLVTAFMASIGKIAAIAAFYRLFSFAFADVASNYTNMLVWISIITMTVGNLMALNQTSLKRMLAYSSIAHAGYMLMAIVASNGMSAGSILYYSLAYGFASIITFGTVMLVEQQKGSANINDLAGFARNNKLIAFALLIALLTLSGIPVTAGFFGKFYLFSAAVQQHQILLVVAGVINSFIGIYYYFAPIIQMYMREGNSEPIQTKSLVKLGLVKFAVILLLAGIIPAIIVKLI